MIEKIQLVVPYYNNPRMLELQLTVWESMPWQFRERFKVILVDDGSREHPAVNFFPDKVAHDVDLELYKIHEDIPWNQNGAHNLGMHVADEGWCICTDIDHVLVPSQLNFVLDMDVDEKGYYTFGRRQRHALTTPFKRHPNSWLLTRETFWESGGYDEDFSGYYGSDSVFRRALDLVAKRHQPDPPYLVVYDETDIPDANTRHFGQPEPGGIRKESKYHSVNHPHLLKKRRHQSKAVDPLRFTWERLL